MPGRPTAADSEEDQRRLALVRSEPNITLLLEQRVNAVESTDGVIRAVVAQHIRTAPARCASRPAGLRTAPATARSGPWPARTMT